MNEKRIELLLEVLRVTNVDYPSEAAVRDDALAALKEELDF